MVIDAHCHMVPTSEGVQTTVERMLAAGVAHTLLVPGGMIPALGLADFLRGRAPLQEKFPNNDFVMDLVRGRPREFSAMYHFCPKVDDMNDAEQALADGFCGFKLNPLVDQVSFEDPVVDDLFALASGRDVPIYSHIVLSGGASLDSLDRLMKRHDRVSLILGHMGFASSDGEAISVAFRYPNMLLETSVGAFHAIEQAYRLLGATKLVYGSEGPAHHPGAELRKLELLRLPAAAFDRITFDNMAGFLPSLRELKDAV